MRIVDITTPDDEKVMKAQTHPQDMEPTGLEGLEHVSKNWAAAVREMYLDCDTPGKKMEFVTIMDRLVVLHDFKLFDWLTPFEWRVLMSYQDDLVQSLLKEV